MGTVTVVGLSLGEMVSQLATVKGAQEEYAPIIDELKNREADIKEMILDRMAADGIERVRDHGIVVTRSTRTTSQVGDMADLVAFLKSKKVLGRYTTIDTKRVIDDLGTDVPGVRLMRTEYVSVRVSEKD